MIAFVSFVFLAAAAAVVVVARPQEMGEEVFDAETKCMAKFPSISREFLENLKHTRKLPENPTDDFKCFIACIGRELQVMSHEGELHFDGLKNLTVAITGGEASHDDAHAMVTKCIDVEHDDNCEKAWQYALCKIDELLPFKFSKGFCPTCTD